MSGQLADAAGAAALPAARSTDANQPGWPASRVPDRARHGAAGPSTAPAPRHRQDTFEYRSGGPRVPRWPAGPVSHRDRMGRPARRRATPRQARRRARSSGADPVARLRRGGLHPVRSPSREPDVHARLPPLRARASMIVTSNKPVSAWGEIFGDDMAATAMVDRLITTPRSSASKAIPIGSRTATSDPNSAGGPPKRPDRYPSATSPEAAERLPTRRPQRPPTEIVESRASSRPRRRISLRSPTARCGRSRRNASRGPRFNSGPQPVQGGQFSTGAAGSILNRP